MRSNLLNPPVYSVTNTLMISLKMIASLVKVIRRRHWVKPVTHGSGDFCFDLLEQSSAISPRDCMFHCQFF